MTARFRFPSNARAAAIPIAALLGGCFGGSLLTDPPQLTPATGAALSGCTDLATRFTYPNTTISAASAVAAGTLTVAGSPVPAHCQLAGRMFQRTSAVDGKSYAIGFEMRLPNAWNGRFFYQANGGVDGVVATAVGAVNGGNGLTNALALGFAVISSDAGHASAQGSTFGIDPQARLDYGYQAAQKLTPMAKAAIATAYGKGPDRSYFGGCSNGGRHTMVAATRMPEQYDGYLVGDPGFRLPNAAVANIAGGQAYAALAGNPADNDIGKGFTAAERATVSNAVLARCDALDGSSDGIVQDTTACQAAFDLARDVPTCTAARDGSCLTAAQKTAIAKLFAGATTSGGARIYAPFPFDAGLGTANWATWKFTFPLALDSGSVGFIFQTPPENPAGFVGATFTLTGNVDSMFAKISATDQAYTESALSFMTPPSAADLSALRGRGARLVLYHGTSDPIFSSSDSTAWYEQVRANNAGDPGGASRFARFFRVPGMNHCSGGPATDQFDLLTPLVNWVEKGVAPGDATSRVIASVRGAGNPAAVNADLPAGWSPTRTRPLCPYPQVAQYKGSGSIDSADSFDCR